MPRINAWLVCGGRWHDFDFARLELLKLLAEDQDVRVRVSWDFRDVEFLSTARCVISYTCDLRPSQAEQEALSDYVRAGGRWFALHGTNSVFEFKPDGVHSPRVLPTLMETLGSQFIAHPPIAPYRVQVSPGADHPFVHDIAPFETADELYLCEYHGEIRPLLETRFSGEARGFAESSWPDDTPRLVAYLHPYGAGEVLYYTLGHCRGRWDMQPMLEEYPRIERGSWELPVHYTLLRRGIAWAKGQLA